ncbi:hypothetical protein B5E80_09440 [Flavonifractor sp. An135]|nr:hypothetical protein [Flavonifractor sp. An135]OUQ23504.1 hypothetical protein B5E80_09440 [Flavonifractor sp. An135]
MIWVVCVDDRNGTAFHDRPQSRDAALRADLLDTVGEKRLWMDGAARRQFTEESPNLAVAEDFPEKAGPGEYCFGGAAPVLPWLERVEAMVVYRWNRTYPADRYLDFDPAKCGWKLVEQREFPGRSHPKLTKEVFVK